MITINASSADCVSVETPVRVPVSKGKYSIRPYEIELRIGLPEQGFSRISILKPSSARELAFALLLYAEQADERSRSK